MCKVTSLTALTRDWDPEIELRKGRISILQHLLIHIYRAFSLKEFENQILADIQSSRKNTLLCMLGNPIVCKCVFWKHAIHGVRHGKRHWICHDELKVEIKFVNTFLKKKNCWWSYNLSWIFIKDAFHAISVNFNKVSVLIAQLRSKIRDNHYDSLENNYYKYFDRTMNDVFLD